MRTEVVITGSGTPWVMPNRAGPGVLVRRGNVTLQFDAGRATTMRLRAAGAALEDLTSVFLTHHHSDHVVGLTDLAQSRWIHCEQADNPLPVVFPSGPLDSMLGGLLGPWGPDVEVRIAHRGGYPPAFDCTSFEAETVPSQVRSLGEVSVTAVLVDHDPVLPAVGYRVDTPEGSVVISGDTRVCDGIETLAAGADLLVHEVYLDEAFAADRQNPIADYHANAIELGRQAARLDLPALMLTHLIPSPDGEELRAKFRAEVESGGYRGEIYVGEDLMSVTLG